VKAEVFTNLFHGFSADGGRKLVRNAGRYDAERETFNRMPGFDLTFSAPKSVSVVWALAEAETRRAVEKAHLEAVRETLAEVERLTVVRTGAGGRIQEPCGVVAGVFQHGTARQVDRGTLPDMQLHSHACVINTGVTADKKTAALKGIDFLNDTFAKEYGAFYRAELAGRMRGLGFELERTKDAWEIKGVPAGLIEECSKRSAQIERETPREESSAKEKLLANNRTKMAKGELDPARIVEHWQETAARHEFTAETVEALRRNRHQHRREDGAAKEREPEERREAIDRRGAVTGDAAKRREDAKAARRAEEVENLRAVNEEISGRGYKVIGVSLSKAKAETMREAGMNAHTAARLLSDFHRESPEGKKERAEGQKARGEMTDWKRKVYAEWKYATHQWTKDTKQKFLGEYYEPTSRLRHEVMYATHQISKGQRDHLNRELERQSRAVDGNTVVVVNEGKWARETDTMQKLTAEVEKRGGKIVYADAATIQRTETRDEGRQAALEAERQRKAEQEAAARAQQQRETEARQREQQQQQQQEQRERGR
jgi:conjugative relaxase-like TrwC/TraI family protein